MRSIQFSGTSSVLHSLCHMVLPAMLIYQFKTKLTSCSNVAVVCCSLYVSNSFVDSKQRTFVTLCRKPLYVWLSNEDLDSQLKEPLPWAFFDENIKKHRSLVFVQELPDRSALLPSPAALTGRVLIRSQKLPPGCTKESDSVSDVDEGEEVRDVVRDTVLRRDFSMC